MNHSAPLSIPPRWQLPLLAGAVVLAYGNNLAVPFYYDDLETIVTNSALHQLDDLRKIWELNHWRFLGNLGFALNHHFHATAVAGYHLVNNLIHLLAALAVWWLARGMLRTPAVTGAPPHAATDYPDSASPLRHLPLLAALGFALHPLHTQAVTYIAQRFESLAGLFYLVSLSGYLHARLGSGTRRWGLAALSLLAAAAALTTKQTTLTLPLALLLLEFIFFPASRKLVAALFMGGTLLAALLVSGTLPGSERFSLAHLDRATTEFQIFPRLSYLATQMRVLLEYQRLFIWPAGLHLDHDLPLAHGFTGQTLLLLGFHLGVVGVGILQIPRRPLLAWGVLFYYLAHGVTSFVINIPDVIFEHRAYLPNSGLMLGVGWLLLTASRRFQSERVLAVVLIPVLLGWGVATWQRNQTWADPVAFWRENLALAPTKVRSAMIYVKLQLKRGVTPESDPLIKPALEMVISRQGRDEHGVSAHPEVALINLVLALHLNGNHREGLRVIGQGLLAGGEHMDRATNSNLLLLKGNIHIALREWQAAREAYMMVLAIDPDRLEAKVNLERLQAAGL